jgi:hypothetical protein
MNTRERGADPLAGWLRGRDPRGAWEHMRHTLDTNGPARALILTLAGTLEGRLALERSRRIWACHGLPAPFDDLLREELGEEVTPPIPPTVATCRTCGAPLVLADLGHTRCAACRARAEC